MRKVLSKIFPRLPKLADGKHRPRTFEIGGGWGNCIHWLSPEEFGKDHDSDTRFSVYGFKRDHPKIGDILIAEFEKSVRHFRFVAVRSMRDPRDQFFADVKCFKVIPK